MSMDVHTEEEIYLNEHGTINKHPRAFALSLFSFLPPNDYLSAIENAIPRTSRLVSHLYTISCTREMCDRYISFCLYLGISRCILERRFNLMNMK